MSEAPPGSAARHDGESSANRDDVVSRLLISAGPRSGAPPGTRRKIERAVFATWQIKVATLAARRRRRRVRQVLLAAAMTIVALGSVVLWQRMETVAPPSLDPVGTVAAVFDAATLRADGRETTLASGQTLFPGAEIRTGAGRAAVALPSGASVRLDLDTRLSLVSADTLVLDRGTIYVDTGAGAKAGTRERTLEVRTPIGVARDIGTRFEVRLLDDALRVRVRDGEVEVEADGGTHAAADGTVLTVHDDGTVERAVVASDDPAWSWTWGVSPAFEIEGRSLAEVLAWVAEETGWELCYENPDLEARAASIVAHGSLSGVTPDQAPDLLLPGTGLVHRVADGALIVVAEE